MRNDGDGLPMFDKAEAERRFHTRSVGLWLCGRGHQPNTVHVLRDATVEEADAYDRLPETPIRLTHEAAQQLADSLWNAGYRATQADAKEGESGALRGHIADLRHALDRVLDLVKKP